MTYQISELSKQSSGSSRKHSLKNKGSSKLNSVSEQLQLDASSAVGYRQQQQQDVFQPPYSFVMGGDGGIVVGNGYDSNQSMGKGSGNTFNSTNSWFFPPENNNIGQESAHHGKDHYYANPSSSSSSAHVTFEDHADNSSSRKKSYRPKKEKASKEPKKQKELKSKSKKSNVKDDTVHDDFDCFNLSEPPRSIEKKRRSKKSKNDDDSVDYNYNIYDSAKSSKRRKNKGEEQSESNNNAADDLSAMESAIATLDSLTTASVNNNNNNNQSTSIINRRRKRELQINVEGAGMSISHLDNINNPHSLVGGVLSGMLPPSGTPFHAFPSKTHLRSMTAAGGALSSLSNLQHFSYNESSPTFHHDMFGPFSDTPTNYMSADLHMSNSFRNDSHADFDEATANHFPSPRTGDFVKGASPSRWSGGSTASIGMFSFPDHPPLSVGGNSIDDIVNAAGMFQNHQEHQDQEESFSKKMKKTKRVDPNKRESNESGVSEISAISGLTALSDNANLINGIYNVEISPRGVDNLLESPYLFDVGVNTAFDGFYSGYDEVK